MSDLEDIVEILTPGKGVDVMDTKYQVRVNLSREPVLSEPFRKRERAERVRDECIETLRTLKKDAETSSTS